MKRRGFIQTLFAGLGAAILPRGEQPETPAPGQRPYKPKPITVTAQGVEIPTEPVKKQEVTIQAERIIPHQVDFTPAVDPTNYAVDPILFVNGEPIRLEAGESVADAINKNPRLPVAARLEKHGIVTLTSKMDKSR